MPEINANQMNWLFGNLGMAYIDHTFVNLRTDHNVLVVHIPGIEAQAE